MCEHSYHIDYIRRDKIFRYNQSLIAHVSGRILTPTCVHEEVYIRTYIIVFVLYVCGKCVCLYRYIYTREWKKMLTPTHKYMHLHAHTKKHVSIEIV